METALGLISAVGGLGAGWLVSRGLDPWRKRVGQNGGAPYRRAEALYAIGVIGSALVGAIVTRMIFLWLG